MKPRQLDDCSTMPRNFYHTLSEHCNPKKNFVWPTKNFRSKERNSSKRILTSLLLGQMFLNKVTANRGKIFLCWKFVCGAGQVGVTCAASAARGSLPSWFVWHVEWQQATACGDVESAANSSMWLCATFNSTSMRSRPSKGFLTFVIFTAQVIKLFNKYFRHEGS